MDKILQRVYENLMREIGVDEISLTLKKNVLHLLGDIESYPDQEAYEKCRYMAFRIAEAGEEAGFYRGFHYAV